MLYYVSHLRRNWMQVTFVFASLMLIVYPEPFVDSLHYILGTAFLIFAVVNFMRATVFHVEGISIGDCLVKAILAVIVIFMQYESIAIIGVIWALWSLEEAGREVDDFLHTRHFSILNLLLLIASIVLSILLIMDPFEHILLHIRYVGIEIIATILLSRNNERNRYE